MRGFTTKLALVVCMVFLVIPALVLAGCSGDPEYFTVNFDFRAGGEVLVEIDGEAVTHATSHLAGSELAITVTPDEGFIIVSVKAGTIDLACESGVYTHTLDGNVTLRVRFAKPCAICETFPCECPELCTGCNEFPCECPELCEDCGEEEGNCMCG